VRNPLSARRGIASPGNPALPIAAGHEEDTLARRRRVSGEEHPATLTSASNLAADLRALGQHEAAHQLDEDTETRRRASGNRSVPTTLAASGRCTASSRAKAP
jgi:hypothetical protein